MAAPLIWFSSQLGHVGSDSGLSNNSGGSSGLGTSGDAEEVNCAVGDYAALRGDVRKGVGIVMVELEVKVRWS